MSRFSPEVPNLEKIEEIGCSERMEVASQFEQVPGSVGA